MASSSKSDFDHELDERETSFNRKIREYICQFLKDVNVDFLILKGSLFRIVTALNSLNNDIDYHKDVERYVGYKNQCRLFADQIQSTTRLEDELNNNLLIICEIPAKIEEEFKNKLINIAKRLEMHRRQKAIFVTSDKSTLENYLTKFSKRAVMHINETTREVSFIGPNLSNDLYQASSAGDMKKVAKLLADGVEVNSRIQDGSERTALHAAVQNGHKNVVLLLLAYGADVQIQDRNQQQPIDLALNDENYDIMLRDIFKIEEKVRKNGDTRLHVAARWGKTEIVRRLVKLEVNINALNNYGATPLHLAVFNRHEETIRTLVNLGADLNRIDSNNGTALDIAKTKFRSIIDYLKSKGVKTAQQVRAAES